jgi:hypothetical protein
MRKLGVTSAILTVALLSSACGSDERGASPSTTAPVVRLGEETQLPDVDTEGDAAEPIDSGATSGDSNGPSLPLLPILNELISTRTTHDAVQRLVQSCMAANGFDYTPSTYIDISADVGQRYGITDLEQARTTGYDTGGALSEPGENAGVAGLSEQARDNWYEAFFGTGSTSIQLASGDAVGISTGGCLDQAESEVFGDRIQRWTIAYQLQDLVVQSYEEARVDPRVQEAFSVWQSCLANRGIPAGDLAAPRSAAAAEPGQHVAIATADAECNIEAGLGATWELVETEIQNRLIVTNESLVFAARDQLDAEADS